MLTITNECNMAMMARYPDNHFDLAICDPPYGIGMNGGRIGKGISYELKSWDNEIPSAEYFIELKRVTKNYIIWGGNYFIKYFSEMKNFLIWDKMQKEDFTFSMCELAIISFDKTSQIFTKSYHSGNNQFIKKDPRIHPTQKPVDLYKYCLSKYAKAGDKILDTHLGSGSIAIACHDYCFDLTACEIDKDYYDAAMKRIDNHVRNATKLSFDKPKENITQSGIVF